MTHELTIRFPDEATLQAFGTWLSDGGGEQAFGETLRPAAVRFQYRPENAEFAPTDRRRYGEWLEDRTIAVIEIEKQGELI